MAVIENESLGGGASRTENKRRSETSGLRRGTEKKLAAIGLALLLLLSGPALADIERARQLMKAGAFEEAREALWPAARSGNADAEELIGVMYALGLGVERDDVRAFEWYLRSAMKGHPGAQSGVGWYYEVGRGMPAPDLVRAYLWYVLSTIGGDPDAAISQEEVIKKMTPEEIEKAPCADRRLPGLALSIPVADAGAPDWTGAPAGIHIRISSAPLRRFPPNRPRPLSRLR